MDPTQEAAAPWWSSRILWTQVVSIILAVIAAVSGRDVAASLGLTPEVLVSAIMAVVALVTVYIRVTHPTPQLTSTQAEASRINNKLALVRAQAVENAAKVRAAVPREAYSETACGNDTVHEMQKESIPKARPKSASRPLMKEKSKPTPGSKSKR